VTTRVVVAGVDGGASSTTCVLLDATGRILGVGRGGPVDHLYRASGQAQTRRALREAFSSARGAAPRDGVPIRAVVAGLTGLEPDSQESRTAVRIIREITRAPRVHATWDAAIAFAGASAGRAGVAVIAGTGSVAYGRNAKGRIARAGGYGYLIDDAGGGMSLGRAALRAVLASADGRGPATALRPLVAARLGGWVQIRRRVYGEGGGRALLASLVPLVEKAALRGDAVAQNILQEAGHELAELVGAVASRLKMLDEAFSVFPVGGVFEMGRLVLDPLRRSLRRRAPRCLIRPPAFPPEVGAALMALEAVGVAPTPDMLQRLARSARRL
jgi:N-acetylglucosamine kinase-like BadF-type ATPase